MPRWSLCMFNRTCVFSIRYLWDSLPIAGTSARWFSSGGFANKVAHKGGGAIRLNTSDPLLAWLTIDNAASRNALTGKMMLELDAAVGELEHRYGGAAVAVRGAGQTFCAGADLELVKTTLSTPADGDEMCGFMQGVLERLRSLPLTSVAIVEGFAVGGGSELCTACDYRIAAPDATIQFKHVHMGLSPGWGGGSRLVHLVGRRKALDLLTSGRPLSAHAALEIGLVDFVTTSSADADLHAAVLEFLGLMLAAAKRSPGALKAVRTAKQIVVGADATPMAAALMRERELFRTLWGSSDNKAQVQSTLNKLKGSKPSAQ